MKWQIWSGPGSRAKWVQCPRRSEELWSIRWLKSANKTRNSQSCEIVRNISFTFAILVGLREATMKRIVSRIYGKTSSFFLGIILVAIVAAAMLSCTKSAETSKPAAAQPSGIKVEVRDGRPVVITTSTAEFQILTSGLVQAALLKDGKRLTLDESGPASAGGSDSIMHDG